MDTKVLVGIYVFFSLAVILSLIVLRDKGCVCDQSDQEEDFRKCLCSDTDKRECQDTETVQKDYEDGTATEYSTFKPHGWSKTSPGDLAWPVSVGCTWPDIENAKKWSSWDFTDFGN